MPPHRLTMLNVTMSISSSKSLDCGILQPVTCPSQLDAASLDLGRHLRLGFAALPVVSAFCFAVAN